MIAALLLAEVAAFLLGYLVRPTIEDLREERRFRRHIAACRHCAAVAASNGPAWLYCAGGRPRGAGPAWERRLRGGLRHGDGVPAPREEVRGDAN